MSRPVPEGGQMETTLPKELLLENMNPIFIETGTNVGMGVRCAAKCGFKTIYSIESNRRFFEYVSVALPEEFPDVDFHFIHGDSTIELPLLLRDLDEPATFWLDGHIEQSIPILGELLGIERQQARRVARGLPKLNHIILIDDVRMFGGHSWNFIGREKILLALEYIDPTLIISYYDSPLASNDILVAKLPGNWGPS